ncbi:MAG TPA: beta-ketoacyl synthase N-terminal-like domain-containing protein [Phycisphaerae bacterium]|nr:beta-ketoacyl synthase N-terminal-like domain-containing protein [Phycisphaerae bacterium]
MHHQPAIAVVGMGGIFPGATDLAAFWRNIVAGLDTTRDVPPNRWILHPSRALADGPKPDRVYSLRGCFVDNFECDPAGLAIDPGLLQLLDPLYHLVLHAGRAAFNDAITSSLDRRRVGVILAAIALPTDDSSAITREILGQAFEDRLFAQQGDHREAPTQLRTHPLNSRVTGLPAALLAQALQLGGGSYTLDAACASSLYALKLACDELREGRADAMLAGGVSRPECLYTQMGFSQLLALSKSGRCAPFDDSCDGLIVGEGAGIVVLKRLDDAMRDGDRIYGVIRGIGLSNDIGGSLLAPDSEGQLRAMRAAYEQAGWSPDVVDLIECHGTGTPTGDAVEIASLRTLWQGLEDPPARCPIGSVKSMIGHLLTGAGAAGFIKVLLAMREGTLPPSANYSDSGRVIPLADSPFRVQTQSESWPHHRDRPRRAAISAFGFGGINAHVLVEECIDHMAHQNRSRKGAPRDSSKASSPNNASQPIAIVGVAAHFGAANSLRHFEQKILNNRAGFHARPTDRWEGGDNLARQWIGGDGARGAYLERLAIPIGKYRLPPTEIPEVLPQQLLLLDVCAAALENARLPLREKRPRVSAIIGMALDFGTTNFHLRWWIEGQARQWAERLGLDLDDDEFEQWITALKDAAGPALNAARTLGALGGMIASRIAREFQLGGPSYAVSCDEASGLKAVEIAARALARGEIDAAVVGAVDLAGDVRNVVTSAMLRDRTDRGDADFIGEGAGAAVLKRLDDAQAAGDRIYAVLNPTEDTARAEATRISAREFVGRTGAADGMASLVMAALCLHHEILLPCDDSDLPTYWWHDRADGPRRAAVEAKSIDGADVCIVLEGFEQSSIPAKPIPMPRLYRDALFAIEADNVIGLLAGLGDLASHRSEDLSNLARQWHDQHRPARDRRLAVSIVASSHEELTDALSTARSALSNDPDQPLDGRKGAFYNPTPLGPTGQLAFVFPGSGNHFPDMGKGIALRWPDIPRALDHVTQRLRSHLILGASPDDPSADDSVHRNIFRQVSYCVLMSDLLRRFGLQPDAVIGYSLGESASLFALRAWPDRDEMFQRMTRSPLFKSDLAGQCRAIRAAWNIPDDCPVDWTVAVVGRPVEQVREALRGVEHARLLMVNSPRECVIGGLRPDMAEVTRRLKSRAVLLEGIPTVHFEAVREVEEAYRDLHLLETKPPAGVRFYSAAAARAYDVTRASAAESITAQALHGFDFPALIEQAYADGVRLFVEVGPQASCTRMIGRILAGRPHFARSASSSGDNEVRDVFQLAAAMIAERIPVDMDLLLGEATSEAEDLSPEKPAKTVTVEIGRKLSVPPLPVKRSRPPQRGAAPPARTVEPVPVAAGEYSDNTVVAEWSRTAAACASAHRAYLQFSEAAAGGMASALAFQSQILESMVGAGDGTIALADLIPDQSPSRKGAPSGPSDVARRSFTVTALNKPVLSRDLCLEFARGSVAKVLGPEFAEVDRHATRVRLPDEPLMLVDRIMEIDGVKGSMTSGRVVTEHDVLADAWYLDGGRAPICITVEAGQADLFLSAYLGIDRITKGLRTYRLLDATVTFHRGLPRPGETIRYDIRIEKFVRQGETYLFFFQFDGTVNDVPVLTMRNGCAGFFTADEIRNSRGIVLTPEELAPTTGTLPADWRPLVSMSAESYDEANLTALRGGDLAGCFGPVFTNLPIADPLKLPGGRMKLIDRVTQLDPTGGRYGLGVIRAEADIHSDDWFLTCHFVDDMVMPGTLMYECCAHTLRMFLLRMGWVGEHAEICYEPVPGVASSLRCRGPVTPKTKIVTYQVEIKEIGYRPEPYVLADAMMYADGEAIVRMTNMSLQMSGTNRERIEQIWRLREGRTRGKLATGFTTKTSSAPLFTRDQILAFCIGNPSDCFGEPFRIFDRHRKCARLPGPPYCFLDRVVSAEPEPFALEPGGWIECEYDVPRDAWYFAANRQTSMPFAVLLEIALQPCGFLAAYAGSALTSETDLSFRNLGGTATLHEELFADCGTLRVRVRMTDVSSAGGMIIEQFDMQVWRGHRLVYDGKTSFGFFSKASLAQQVGIRDAKDRIYVPPHAEAQRRRDRFSLPNDPPFTPDDATASPQASSLRPQAFLPARAFRMIDQIDVLLPDGGPHGLGFIQGSTRVDPAAWFFKAHFYQDPVWPGSLGLESFLQLLKVFALDRWPDLAATHRFEPIAAGTPHTWAYRGQIIPSNRRVEVQAVITRHDDGPTPTVMADGFLSVDGITIYEMKNFGSRLTFLR